MPSPGGGNASPAWDTTVTTGSMPTPTVTNPVLDPYLKNRNQSSISVWNCPDNAARPAVAPTTTGTYYLNYPRSYTMNGLLRNPGSGTVSGSPATVGDPDATNYYSTGPREWTEADTNTTIHMSRTNQPISPY